MMGLETRGACQVQRTPEFPEGLCGPLGRCVSPWGFPRSSADAELVALGDPSRRRGGVGAEPRSTGSGGVLVQTGGVSQELESEPV